MLFVLKGGTTRQAFVFVDKRRIFGFVAFCATNADRIAMAILLKMIGAKVLLAFDACVPFKAGFARFAAASIRRAHHPIFVGVISRDVVLGAHHAHWFAAAVASTRHRSTVLVGYCIATFQTVAIFLLCFVILGARKAATVFIQAIVAEK
jgi:hypothetical protein